MIPTTNDVLPKKDIIKTFALYFLCKQMNSAKEFIKDDIAATRQKPNKFDFALV